MSERDIFVEKIRKAKKEAETAGALHKRDLEKHIHRMEVQLMRYDRYHNAN